MSKGLNAQQVLDNVSIRIAELESMDGWLRRTGFYTRDVCNELSIFDWWTERLSLSQLKAMRAFLNQAIRMGFTGYACFKVGAKYCASGMWAYRAESEDGFSPSGDFLYRSFQSAGNYWDAQVGGTLVTEAAGVGWDAFNTAAKLRKAMVA